MHVRVCTCGYAWMCVHAYTCVHTCTDICRYTYVCLHAFVHTCTHMCGVHVCAGLCTHLYTCVHVCEYRHAQVYALVCTGIVRAHADLCTYVHVCVCRCECVCQAHRVRTVGQIRIPASCWLARWPVCFWEVSQGVERMEGWTVWLTEMMRALQASLVTHVGLVHKGGERLQCLGRF